MSRTLRPHLPGACFHITTRTHRKEPWFDQGNLHAAIADFIYEGVTSSDVRLIAQTVMSNHFHIVLQQGRRPLGWVMQPIVRRAALLVQRTIKIKGHVFERRYRCKHCETPTHLRRSIIYTNINPHRAGLCANGNVYPWTSHSQYLMDEKGIGVSAIEIAYTLPLFAGAPDQTLEELRAAYRRHVDWRIEKDACDAAGIPYDVPEPACSVGDDYFLSNFVSRGGLERLPLKDLRDRALDLLWQIDPRMPIEQVRCRYGTRQRTQIRNQVIAGLLQSGYRCKSIADYLRVSDSTVSVIASKMRFAKS